MAGQGDFPGIAERIALAVDKAGGQGKAAAAVGASRAAIQKWRTENARPPLIEMFLLAREAGVSLEWIVTGIEPLALNSSSVISRFAPDASGNPVRQPPDADTLAVHSEFFALHRLDDKKTGIVRVVGDAMAGELPDGSLVIVDMRPTNFTDEGLWVLGRSGAVMVRRLVFEGDTARLYTANPNYRDIAIKGGEKHEFTIWGRVALALTRK